MFCALLNAAHFEGQWVLYCLFTLVSIKMEHPRPLQVCTNVCIIFAHTGAGVIRVKQVYICTYRREKTRVPSCGSYCRIPAICGTLPEEFYYRIRL